MTITTALTSTDLIASGGDDGIEIETHSGGGGGGSRQIAGTSGNDTLKGTSGDDTIFGGGGDDTIDGGAGRDIAVYSGRKSEYTVTPNAAGAVVVKDNGAAGDGTDTLTNVERLKFKDGNIDFDPGGHGAEAYRLYQAALNRAPDTAGLGYWAARLDSGASLKDLAESFLHSQEFSDRFGSLDTTSYVAQMYVYALHRTADAGGQAYWQDKLATGAIDRAEMLMYFSESAENQAALVGTIKAGISY